jgi:hypothetical protein
MTPSENNESIGCKRCSPATFPFGTIRKTGDSKTAEDDAHDQCLCSLALACLTTLLCYIEMFESMWILVQTALKVIPFTRMRRDIRRRFP